MRSRYAAALGGAVHPGLLYGKVVWFVGRYQHGQHPDADNIRKPVWDALKGVAFEDDRQVRLRTAAVVDLASPAMGIGPSIGEFDLTRTPRSVRAGIQRIFDRDGHHTATHAGFCYVEIGAFSYDLLLFDFKAEALASQEIHR